MNAPVRTRDCFLVHSRADPLQAQFYLDLRSSLQTFGLTIWDYEDWVWGEEEYWRHAEQGQKLDLVRAVVGDPEPFLQRRGGIADEEALWNLFCETRVVVCVYPGDRAATEGVNTECQLLFDLARKVQSYGATHRQRMPKLVLFSAHDRTQPSGKLGYLKFDARVDFELDRAMWRVAQRIPISAVERLVVEVASQFTRYVLAERAEEAQRASLLCQQVREWFVSTERAIGSGQLDALVFDSLCDAQTLLGAASGSDRE